MKLRLRPRSEHWLLRWFGDDYWTTLGGTIWYPSRVRDPHAYPSVIEHELIHIEQQRGWPVWFWVLLYLVFPVPVFFAWFRWRAEREAYLLNINEHGHRIDWAVNSLWAYGWPWPKPWMRRWFEKHQERNDERG